MTQQARHRAAWSCPGQLIGYARVSATSPDRAVAWRALTEAEVNDVRGFAPADAQEARCRAS